jgi:hypothetical protein
MVVDRLSPIQRALLFFYVSSACAPSELSTTTSMLGTVAHETIDDTLTFRSTTGGRARTSLLLSVSPGRFDWHHQQTLEYAYTVAIRPRCSRSPSR